MSSKHTTLAQLKLLAQRTKTELTALEDKLNVGINASFKSLAVSGNTVSFYTTADQSGAAAATLDFPSEAFLDQNKTKFVDSFAWSEADYPGSTNPNMEGKPVFVLAVKGETAADSVSYSFVNMATLVDTYKAKTEGKDGSTTITISGYEIDVSVNVYGGADNLLKKRDEDGTLYVGHDDTKMDKPTSATQGNVATFDANKNPVDSGKKIGGATLATGDAADTTGSILATEAAVRAAQTAAGESKADKVTGATAGNFAGLDANGNLTDSGKKAGGATMAAAPDADTLATEAAVKAALDALTADNTEVETMLNEVFGAETPAPSNP